MKGKRRDSLELNQFGQERLSEQDIEEIWKKMTQRTGKERKMTGGNQTSVDTTPTTDYSGNLIPLHPANLEEELKNDQDLARMNSVLRAKKLKPKTYLPQVILYDNVSHDRLLAMRLEEIRESHKAAERRAKRRQETFVRSLQRRQEEWTRRDAKMVAKLDPDNLPELTFTFGRLYNKPDYPYQAAIQTLSTKQPPPRALADHARRRPTLLPQITNRPIYDDEEEDRTFITKLPRKHRNLRGQSDPSTTGQDGIVNMEESKPNRRRNNRRKQDKPAEDCTTDSRFQMLTNLLGERYSPKKKIRPREVTKQNANGLVT